MTSATESRAEASSEQSTSAGRISGRRRSGWKPQLGLGRDNLLNLTEAFLEPVVLTLATLFVAYYSNGEITPAYLLLAILLFSMSFPGAARLQLPLARTVVATLVSWLFIASLAMVFGYTTHWIEGFKSDAIQTWLWLCPSALVISQIALRIAAPVLVKAQGAPQNIVLAGMNEQGVSLARQLLASPYSGDRILGFFDDRAKNRLLGLDEFALLGKLDNLGKYVKENRVQKIYLSLPMATQPRILRLLDDLKDTTCSIYFIPDMFVTDLIQSRVDSVCGMPVVAVCETPFTGWSGVVKRASDFVLALILLLLLAPLMLAIAIAVKASSPGPVVFRQRRYGLDGEEIVVYKFRSMRVCEDGEAIRQAHPGDPRITPIGSFLRRTSMDELPQFVNVLQGRMSIVGPRPHAVAHNELYRKLIKGYMVRHKVKPGITGWAQVNGYRGETESLEKMQARIEYDLDYLRNWSLGLDLRIVAKTVGVVLKGQNAH